MAQEARPQSHASFLRQMGLNGGHSSPMEHNMGNNFSIFTSWSVYKLTAQMWATSNGPGGLVLTKQFSATEIVPSPDIFSEGEVLIPGVVTGATVTKPGQ
jgi:hypothetical protein